MEKDIVRGRRCQAGAAKTPGGLVLLASISFVIFFGSNKEHLHSGLAPYRSL